MKITTFIELENDEVEKRAGAKLVFSHEKIEENIVETCVDFFQDVNSSEKIATEDAMRKVFEQLKLEGIVPQQVKDFSFEMPSCGQIKGKLKNDFQIPQKIILMFKS